MMSCFLQKIYIPCGPSGITAVKHRSMPTQPATLLRALQLQNYSVRTLYVYPIHLYLVTPL